MAAQPSTFYEHNSTVDVDARLAEICKTLRCKYRPNYNAVTTMHAKRQLFSEHQVGAFLHRHQGDYDAAVVIGSDIYVPRPIVPSDLERVFKHGKKTRGSPAEILTTNNNNGANGVTNGFYVGRPAIVAKVMTRIVDTGNFPEKHDYEHQLIRAFKRHGVRSAVYLQNFDWHLQSFAKLRYSPGVNPQEGSSGLYWPDDKYVSGFYGRGKRPSPMVVDAQTISCLENGGGERRR